MLNTLTRMPEKGTRPESGEMALAAALRAALAAGLLVLLARARMALGLAPFALALFAAGLYGRVHPAALVAGCALGALRFPLWETDVLFACGCAIILLGALLLERFAERARLDEGAACALLAGLVSEAEARGHMRLPPWPC